MPSTTKLLPLSAAGPRLKPSKPLGPDMLRVLVRSGDLKAVKVGNKWMVTPQAIDACRKRRARRRAG